MTAEIARVRSCLEVRRPGPCTGRPDPTRADRMRCLICGRRWFNPPTSVGPNYLHSDGRVCVQQENGEWVTEIEAGLSVAPACCSDPHNSPESSGGVPPPTRPALLPDPVVPDEAGHQMACQDCGEFEWPGALIDGLCLPCRPDDRRVYSPGQQADS